MSDQRIRLVGAAQGLKRWEGPERSVVLEQELPRTGAAAHRMGSRVATLRRRAARAHEVGPPRHNRRGKR